MSKQNTNNSWSQLHECNTENKYYQYCLKNDLPLTALPSGHCIFCGDVMNNKQSGDSV